MTGPLVDEREEARPPRNGGIGKLALLAGKLAVTAACFWYVSRQIDVRQVVSAVALLDFRWAIFATLIAVLQIPILALRWYGVLEALAALDARATRLAITSITAIACFFSQVMPSLASDGMRAWFLVRLGCNWRNALTSVAVDRAVGLGLLIGLGFVILLLPAGAVALGASRAPVLGLYGALLFAGLFGLWMTPVIVPLLARWRYSRWIALLAADARGVMLGRTSPVILALGCLIHALTILIVWLVGRAQGLALPVADAAVLFTVMIGVAVVPISIGGWGLREVAVISLLGNVGVAPEKALLFSVCFGLALAIGSLPGALIWLIYSLVPMPQAAGRAG